MRSYIMRKEILVLDYGSQYNQLVCRRVRDEGVYSEICSYKDAPEKLKQGNVIGIILTGGPHSVYESNSFSLPKEVLESKLPVLGICYGFQLLSYYLGGEVKGLNKSEFGNAKVNVINSDSLLLKNIPSSFISFMSHNDSVTKLPSGFIKNAETDSCPNAIASDETRKIYGVQFHPEVNDTEFGQQIIRNFLFEIVKADKNWTMENFIEDKVKEIKEKVKPDERVLLGLSGGVDSSVTAALLSKAIGKRLTCVFVNHGLLRKNEVEEVIDTFKNFDLDFKYVDASKDFYKALAGVTEPEEKRKIIGKLFVETFRKEADKLGKIDYLAQGTIYPDVVESGLGGNSAKIKSHHNVGGLPKDIGFKGLVEPLRYLFKDEVRRTGLSLGLPESLVFRQPFPGPGLGIRIIGEVTAEKIKIVQDADYILREEIKNAGYDKQISQYYAALTNMKTVGVQGDGRSYDYAVVIRAVKTIDFMTAKPFDLPYSILTRIADRIVDEVDHVSRVFFDYTSKPPATIEME